MARIIDFPDGFTSSTEPTTGGAIASFAEPFSSDAAYEAVYGTGTAGSFYFNTTLNKIRIHDGTDWRTNERALDNATTSDPTVSDDNTLGYEILSLWLNTSSGALFRAVDVSTGAAVWTELAADAVLDSHISDTSTHGITSAIVGESETQVLTNKDIDGGTASNTSRITLPKDTKANLDLLTRKEGTVWYASDEDKLYTDDGVQLNELTGGGAGGGGLDVFATQDFEDGAYANNDSGNNATFLTAGTLDGTFALETTSPISKTQSWKYTASTASNNDWLEFEVIDLDLKQRSTDIKVRLSADMSGFSNDVTFVVYDKTNSAILSSTLDVLTASTDRTFYEFSVFVPSNCAQISYGVHINNGATDTESFLIDDVEWSTNPFVNAEILEEQVATYTGYLSRNPSNHMKLKTLETSEGNGLFSIDNTGDHTRYTFLRECSFIATVAASGSGSSGTVDTLHVSSSDVLLKKALGAIGPSGSGASSITSYAQAGDYILMQVNTITPNDNIFNNFSLKAQATSTHIVTPASSSETNTNFLTSNISTASTVDIADLRFTELIVGQWYMLDYQARISSGSTTGAGTLKPLHDGVEIAEIRHQGGGSTSQTTGNTKIFQATTDTLTFDWSRNGGSTQILIGNGASTGTFAQLTNITRQFLAAVPVQKVAYLRDEKTSGTPAGNTVADTIYTRDLNVIDSDSDSEIVSLSANQFTLSAGKYIIKARVPSYKSDRVQAFLYNNTDSVYLDGESGFFLQTTTAMNNYNEVERVVTITSSKTFEVRQYFQTGSTNGLGINADNLVGNNPQSSEIYTTVKITKLR